MIVKEEMRGLQSFPRDDKDSTKAVRVALGQKTGQERCKAFPNTFPLEAPFTKIGGGGLGSVSNSNSVLSRQFGDVSIPVICARAVHF